MAFTAAHRDCEQYGRLTSKEVSFNSEEEAAEVEEVFQAAIQCLGAEDRQLEPIVNLLPMLKRVHTAPLSQTVSSPFNMKARVLCCSPELRVLSVKVQGIGVHHSGLLPILKELVELLFQTQLVKVNPEILCAA